MRKMAWDYNLSWVELLPRVLRIHHDTPDPVTGLSPHQIVFGRDRVLGGLPWSLPKECEDAVEFLRRMEEVDVAVAEKFRRPMKKLPAK